MRTMEQVLAGLPTGGLSVLKAPAYVNPDATRETFAFTQIGLAVESMKRHTTDEGYQIFAGLNSAGYPLAGRGLEINEVSVPKILAMTSPGTVVVQDEREWDVAPRDFRDKAARFIGIEELARREDIFKVTILKDAHQRPAYHRASAERMGCHGWIIYYHPAVVKRVAPWVREEHLIRTYHSLDRDLVPPFRPEHERVGTLLSGAVSSAYPLRQRLFAGHRALFKCQVLRHPGYGMRGCVTPAYLKLLNGFRVAICTSSIYGYALRKIIEATACGCVVVTDLPPEDHLPEIDENLVRIDSHSTVEDVSGLLRHLCKGWDEGRQRGFAEKAKDFYDFRAVGRRLADDIEALRIGYNSSSYQRALDKAIKVAEAIIAKEGATTMNEEECLKKMIAPGTKRPGKWRGGVIQIHVTRACDKACFNCTQGSNLAGKPVMISVEQFEQACLSLRGYFGVVGMFGGNPAMHPRFEELCEVMRRHVPFEQRGLWCNNPLGHGATMRATFNPAVSNLNCHLDAGAYAEFKKFWPESQPFGLREDSRHSPVFVSMKDLGMPKERRWELISRCDINQHWSAMIGVFRGQLRAWFCEVAGAQAMLHQWDQQFEPYYPEQPSSGRKDAWRQDAEADKEFWDYPDTGMEIDGVYFNKEADVRPWWQLPMQAFAHQVRKHCHECGVPLRGHGELAQSATGKEQTSLIHLGIYRPKTKFREVQQVTEEAQLGVPLERMTDYVGNARR